MAGVIWPPPVDRETQKPLYEWQMEKVEDQIDSLGTMLYQIRLLEQQRFDTLLWTVSALALGIVLIGITTFFMLLYFINNFTI